MASPGAADHLSGGTRRSPPSETGEHRRRTRPRHSGIVSSPGGDGPTGGSARPLSSSAVPSPSSHSPPSRDRYPLADYHLMRAQDRARELAAMHLPRVNARQSQPRPPSAIYPPYSWEDSPLLDPSGRHTMPAAGTLPPMPGFSAQHPQQHNSLHRSPPGTQPLQPGQQGQFPYFQSMGASAQRDRGATGLPPLSPRASGPDATVATGPSADTDTPMPDRDPAL